MSPREVSTPRTEDRPSVLSLEAFLLAQTRLRLAMGDAVMARKTTPARGAKKRADDLFSKIVRSRGRCEHCGELDYSKLQCAHIISRRFNNTRCDEDNALALCAKCHHYFTDHPVNFGNFVNGYIGEEQYKLLVLRSLENKQRTVWIDVVQRLELRAQELELA